VLRVLEALMPLAEGAPRSYGRRGSPSVLMSALLLTAFAQLSTEASAEIKISGGSLLASDRCAVQFMPATDQSRSETAPLSTSPPVSYSASELKAWRQRAVGKPSEGSVAVLATERSDWERVQLPRRTRSDRYEYPIDRLDAGSIRGVHGTVARNAAFVHLIRGDKDALDIARVHLLEQVRSKTNDFWGLCISPVQGPPRDAWFFEASWLLRHAVLYDFIRHSLGSNERREVERWLRNNARFLAAQMDWGISQIFPGRQSADYEKRAGPAAAEGDNRWYRRRFDTNGDCVVDASDEGARFVVIAYVRRDGTSGPKLSTVSQYYNNRRAASAASFGFIGVLLSDSALIERASRYFQEWLAFSVWPDGSQGEYNRNGDYCIAGQGLVYAASNVQGMGVLATALARHGDRSLLDYSTREGIFGSESIEGQAHKSLGAAIEHWARLKQGEVVWYRHEPWRERQLPRPETRLTGEPVLYNKNSRLFPFHELGLFHLVGWLEMPAMLRYLEDTLEKSGVASGAVAVPAVDTGFGSMTDVFNAFPAAVLVRGALPAVTVGGGSVR